YINGYWYYFNTSTGEMATGFQTITTSSGVTKKVYYNSSGQMLYGWQTIGSYQYYFTRGTGELQVSCVAGSASDGYGYVDSNGRKTASADSNTAAMIKKAQSYSSSTNWLILVNCSTNKVGIFYGSKGNWTLKYYWSCTTGASSTPTVKGSYTVGSKGLSFSGSNYTCWYYTQFYGNYLFHSVLYSKGSMTSILDGRLGMNLSHGCVRLSLSNAKWIYDNIPTSTKVISY
ncbi:MAG: L,D-transpeptidase family protein, partial [Lachnospiraceae bacterium]|nr:L,D-transpeptidase family protein [Lachnospiraceae bacterium]